MPATLDDLAAGLRQFFATRFPLDGDDGPGSVLLVFDNLGRPLSAREFTGSGTDAAIDLLAHQRAAGLADQLPAANALRRGWYLPRGGSRLSRWYADMLRASTGPAGGPDLASFEAAKAAALRDLEHNRLITVSGTAVGGSGGTVDAAGTFDTYYATSMSPSDWFTDTATGWETYRIGADDQPDPAPSPAGPVATPEFSFLVAEDPSRPEVIQYVEYATLTEPKPPEPPEPDPQPDWLMSGLNLPAPAATAFREEFTPIEDPIEWDGPGFDLDPGITAPSTATAVVNAAVPTPATSGGFAVRFDFCLIRLDRPWWNDMFLHRRDWRLPGYAAGQVSSGVAARPDGEITLITIGMLVIRNLSITANWSAADLAALPRSTSLGPFCIAAGGFDHGTGTLTRQGMQAIGWLCQVPPRMPPV